MADKYVKVCPKCGHNNYCRNDRRRTEDKTAACVVSRRNNLTPCTDDRGTPWRQRILRAIVSGTEPVK